ncbi:MerR family transcriptional regulator [Profundibacter amoris]|uniref:MerR family transcriptional regulator n=1 Tax=Profundibacter amoris TaxID=2171755 RepID=A0A347UF43_9RHOB|nr:MerR family transcriptional regulator [Profundibacter amoris]AXX97471.1 MerR family transcriptional regulator [Profundibacter amoris]
MMIGEFARAAGLSIYTVRFYEKIGLIPAPPRDAGGRRVYSDDSLGWIRFLKQLNATGMKQADRVRYAALRLQGEATYTERRKMLEAHYDKIRADLTALQKTSDLMQSKISLYQRLEAELAASEKDNNND